MNGRLDLDQSKDLLLSVERFLGQQRWFAGKGRSWQVKGARTLGWLQTDMPAVRIVLVTVAYDDEETETYQLPLVEYASSVEHLSHALVAEDVDLGDGPRYLYDALHDKTVTPLWLDGICERRAGEGWLFHRDRSATEMPEWGPSIVVGAEQSNTSVVFGNAVILKVFRKISPGINPDIEVHAALAAVGSPHIAPPLGWLEGRLPAEQKVTAVAATGESKTDDDQAVSLAMAQLFLHNSTEGWETAKTSVRDLYAEGDLHADEVGGDFASEAYRLGVATADVHRALAQAFPTGILSSKQLKTMASDMSRRLAQAVKEIEGLEVYKDKLKATFNDLAMLTEPVAVQRVHGDYHLGQVMRTLDGWKLLDFEGEPARPLASRRALDTPLKDVAGMLRSFDYAARHLLADHPSEPHLEYRATEWVGRNVHAFCMGYGESIGRDPREQRVLLRACEIDKAIYEAVYESRNRPSWLRIPMSAIERLATAEPPARDRRRAKR